MFFRLRGEQAIMAAKNLSTQPIIGQCIAVVGTAGSGKTTLAAQLARLLNVRHVELDALHWGADWAEPPLDVFRARVADALNVDAWVVDGNYSKVRDMIWERADTVVWLDYSLPVILVRLAKRTFHRTATGEELWNGNRETFRRALLSRDSILMWALKTYRRRRREYPLLFGKPEYRHLTIIHLASPGAADRWLAQIEVSGRQIPHPDVR
jgi:adenylate kinase family enzyme